MKKTLLAVLLFAGLLSFSTAQAKLPSLQPSINKQFNNPILSQAEIDAAKKTRCDKLTAAMENRINTFEKRKSDHVNAYENLKSRLNTLVSKLDSRGYEVADLKAEILILENKIDKLKGDYDTFLSKLNEIKSYACDHTNAEVQIKLTESRALLKTVHSDSDDVRNYFKTVVRPDIVQIRNQKLSN